MSKEYHYWPELVRHIMHSHKAWLVGSAASYHIRDSSVEPSDFDVLVPPSQWNAVCCLIRLSGQPVTLNSFGGLKIGGNIDVFTMLLEDYFTGYYTATVAYRWKPETIIRCQYAK